MIISFFVYPVMYLPALLDEKALLSISNTLDLSILLNITFVKMILSFIIYVLAIIFFYQHFKLVKIEDLKAFFLKGKNKL